MEEIKGKTPVDFFLRAYKLAAETEKSSEKKSQVYKAIGRNYQDGMQPIDRKVKAQLHPDRPENMVKRQRDPGWKQKLDHLRNQYEVGRADYLKTPYDGQMEALKSNELPVEVLDAHQTGQVSTKLIYSKDVVYDLTMGDIFFHPHQDKFYINETRTVPEAFEIRETRSGYINLHFMEYGITNPSVRKRFIDICLKSMKGERDELETVRQHAEQALLDELDIKDMTGLIKSCNQLEESARLREFGVVSEINDPKVKSLVLEFLYTASRSDAYLVAGCFMEVCEKYRDLPLVKIVEHAKKEAAARREKNAMRPETDFSSPLQSDEAPEGSGLPLAQAEQGFSGIGEWGNFPSTVYDDGLSLSDDGKS